MNTCSPVAVSLMEALAGILYTVPIPKHPPPTTLTTTTNCMLLVMFCRGSYLSNYITSFLHSDLQWKATLTNIKDVDNILTSTSTRN